MDVRRSNFRIVVASGRPDALIVRKNKYDFDFAYSHFGEISNLEQLMKVRDGTSLRRRHDEYDDDSGKRITTSLMACTIGGTRAALLLIPLMNLEH